MLKNKFKPDKNNPRLDWDEMFMNIALISGQRAACIYHKVGSVFVDQYNRIVSIGYNGPSRGDYHCNEVGCAKIHGNPLTGKLEPCRGVHSEKNAIINCGNTDRLRNSTLYVTVFPCYRCMRELNNLGISRIVYLKTFKKIIPGSNDKRNAVRLLSRSFKISESKATPLPSISFLVLAKKKNKK